MSFRVFVIPEDFRKDQYLLRPIIQKLAEACRKKARVRICTNPLLGGDREALKWERIKEIIHMYRGVTDCFLLIVDRDDKEHRYQRLQDLETKAEKLLGADRFFLAENAWQEVEVWVLAGMTDLDPTWSWSEVRAHRDSKEAYFLPYAKQRGLDTGRANDLSQLASEAASNYPRIRHLCKEDVRRLEMRLHDRLST